MTAAPLPLLLCYVALVGLLALAAWVAQVDRDGVTVWTWPEGEK